MEIKTITNKMNGCTLEENMPTKNGFGNPSESIVIVTTSPNNDAHNEICKDIYSHHEHIYSHHVGSHSVPWYQS